MSHFYTEGDIVAYQNNMIIYMCIRKETIMPEKENRKSLKEPGLYEQICLPGQDVVRTFSEEDIQIPIYDIPLQQRARTR